MEDIEKNFVEPENEDEGFPFDLEDFDDQDYYCKDEVSYEKFPFDLRVSDDENFDDEEYYWEDEVNYDNYCDYHYVDEINYGSYYGDFYDWGNQRTYGQKHGLCITDINCYECPYSDLCF